MGDIINTNIFKNSRTVPIVSGRIMISYHLAETISLLLVDDSGHGISLAAVVILWDQNKNEASRRSLAQAILIISGFCLVKVETFFSLKTLVSSIRKIVEYKTNFN